MHLERYKKLAIRKFCYTNDLFLPLYERDYRAEVMIRRKKDWWISPSIVRRERCHQHERCDNKDANVHMTQADAAVKYNPAISASWNWSGFLAIDDSSSRNSFTVCLLWPRLCQCISNTDLKDSDIVTRGRDTTWKWQNFAFSYLDTLVTSIHSKIVTSFLSINFWRRNSKLAFP